MFWAVPGGSQLWLSLYFTQFLGESTRGLTLRHGYRKRKRKCVNKETIASTGPLGLFPKTEEDLWEGVWNSIVRAGSVCRGAGIGVCMRASYSCPKWSVLSLTSMTSPSVCHLSISYIRTYSWKWQHLNYWEISGIAIFTEEETWCCVW